MIRNLVFDFGQVLIRWEPELLMAHLDLPQGDRALLKQKLFQSVLWLQLDRGTLTDEEALREAQAALPPHLWDAARDLIFGWWQRPQIPMPGMAELLRELKAKGYGIYLLSNTCLHLREYFDSIPGAECFDGLLVSSEEKLLKPQREIYEALYRRFGLKPEECFFVDDNPANVEAALCTGMAGTVFRGDVPALRRELKKRNIL